MIRTQIQLAEDQYRKLKELAVRERASLAELVRRALDDFIARSAVVSAEERRRRAIEAAGRFHSGLGDLAENHDKYLGEAYGEVAR